METKLSNAISCNARLVIYSPPGKTFLLSKRIAIII
jgi:hypothetical protein